METKLNLKILPQPDDDTCGPACLHAVYRFYGDDLPLAQVAAEVDRLENRGTLAVMLANHALRRGYQATIYTYHVQVFDPTWFGEDGHACVDIAERLRAQMAVKSGHRLHMSSMAFQEFLALGGKVLMEDLTTGLIRRPLRRSIPILTGLSAAYLYRCPRERPSDDEYDDIRGEPMGHFVVLTGYSSKTREVLVQDPLQDNPRFPTHEYSVDINRLVSSILLGVLTQDANLLMIEPKRRAAATATGAPGAARKKKRNS